MTTYLLMYKIESSVSTKHMTVKYRQNFCQRFMRRVKGGIRRHLIRNNDIRDELNEYALNNSKNKYKDG